MAIDESRPFQPLRLAVLTVSDSRTEATDRSGGVLCELATSAGHHIAARRIVVDRRDALVDQLMAWAEDPGVDVVLTTGGTGVTERDVTPEAVHEVCGKLIPGFGELFRQISFEIIGTSTVQSRATAGVCRGTYIFSLPGSPNACRDGWQHILAPQLDIRHRPCNFAELIPRLRADRSPRFEPLSAEAVAVAVETWGDALIGDDPMVHYASEAAVCGPDGELREGHPAILALLSELTAGADAVTLQGTPTTRAMPGGLSRSHLVTVHVVQGPSLQRFSVATTWQQRAEHPRIRSQHWARISQG